MVKIKNTYVSQVLKIENDCVHHPRNSVTLDASVAFDKFDRKRKERKRKKKITYRQRYPRKEETIAKFLDSAFITFESFFDIVKFQRVPILLCNVAGKCRKSEKHFYSVAAISLITLQTF